MNGLTKFILATLGAAVAFAQTDQGASIITQYIAPLLAAHPSISAIVVGIVAAGKVLLNPSKTKPE